MRVREGEVCVVFVWCLQFLLLFASVSVCDTACPCSMPAVHFAVREIELLFPTSHSCQLREWLVVPVVIVLTHLVSRRKLPVLVFSVFLVSSSLALCWMCRSSVCFMLFSCSAFGFYKSPFLLLPAVGFSFLLLAIGYALVLLVVGHTLSLLFIFSPLLLGMLLWFT